jgi:ribosomal protein L5
MVPEAQENSAHLHIAGMIVQAITNVRATAHKARHNVVGWGLREGKFISVTADAEREDAYNFIAKLVDVVLPRIKEWKGVPGSSGDGSGNITFGLTPDQLSLFPEVEVNYDAYVVFLLCFVDSLANTEQVPAENDSRLPYHHTYRRNQQQGCTTTFTSRRYSILRKAE